MMYHDHLIKLVRLRPLIYKELKVATYLFHKFCIPGAHFLLLSSNGIEFANKVINYTKSVCSILVIVHNYVIITRAKEE